MKQGITCKYFRNPSIMNPSLIVFDFKVGGVMCRRVLMSIIITVAMMT